MPADKKQVDRSVTVVCRGCCGEISDIKVHQLFCVAVRREVFVKETISFSTVELNGGTNTKQKIERLSFF